MAQPSSFDTRPEALALLRREPRLALDIGCGSGGFGYGLKQHFGSCRVWGWEQDPASAQFARGRYDRVVETPLDQADWRAEELQQRFDLVVLFDVLARQVDPWALLNRLHRWIEPDAHVLAGLPNVSNLPLLLDAMHGHWRYRASGLLDFRNLRFFADFDARKMFWQCGFRVLDQEVVMRGAGKEIFERHKDDGFPLVLSVEDMSLRVETREKLKLLCADENLYLLEPHRGEFRNAQEKGWATQVYPQTHVSGRD